MTRSDMQYDKSGKYVIPAHRSATPQPKVRYDSRVALPLVPPRSKDIFVHQGKTGMLLANGHVSTSHVRKADWIIRALPEGIRERLRQSGCQVKLGRTMDEIFPDLKAAPTSVDDAELQRPWRRIRGCTRNKVIAIPEFIQPEEDAKLVAQSAPGRGLDVLRHELGHAVHNISPILFDHNGVNDKFYDAYMADLKKLSPRQRELYRYYIQTADIRKPNALAMKEICAELFAALHGGGCRDADEIRSAFPKTARYLRQALANLAKKAI